MANVKNDILGRHGAKLKPGRSGTRLLVDNINVIFVKQSPDHLRPIISQAVVLVLEYLKKNLERSELEFQISDYQLEQLAIDVASSQLYVENMSQNSDDESCDQDLSLSNDSMGSNSMWTQILFFCQHDFPKNEKAACIALFGISESEYLQWIKAQQMYWDR